MLIEASDHTITYKWPKGEICFVPGQPVDVSVERGARILKKCWAKVRAVTPLVIGAWVEFRSPIFGLCSGRIMNLEVEAVRIGDHSVTKEVMTIPISWVMKTLEGV